MLIRTLLEQLLAAVRDLHKLNIVHGDIKLENILLEKCVSASTGCKKTPSRKYVSASTKRKRAHIDYWKCSFASERVS